MSESSERKQQDKAESASADPLLLFEALDFGPQRRHFFAFLAFLAFFSVVSTVLAFFLVALAIFAAAETPTRDETVEH